MHGGRAGRRPTHGRYTRSTVDFMREVRDLTKAVKRLL